MQIGCLSILPLGLLCLPAFVQSQTDNPYHINGSAYQENCNCYTLTDDLFNRSGSVWNINKIDLNQSFEFKFNVNLGCRDGDGADGLVFVLQPISTSIGATGGGLGFTGISPSIGVELDTWQNIEDQENYDDPAYDHIAILTNGVLNHKSPTNLAGPVKALSSSDNIEDCQWHTFTIIWDAAAKIIKARVDGEDRVEAPIDLVATIFGGDPLVFWGFTAATGGARNHQRFCTSLNPKFLLPADKKDGICFPDIIQFTDSSASFGSIVSWFWDFGDGTKDSVKTPLAHAFPAPGIYDVKLNIVGNNGCLSDTFFKEVIVGTKPVADFGWTPEMPCENAPVTFTDNSFVQYGTFGRWAWSIDNQPLNEASPNFVSGLTVGSHVIGLTVATKQNCVSEPVTKTVEILPRPALDMSIQEACLGDSIGVDAINLSPGLPVVAWNWLFGDGGGATSMSARHSYPTVGQYPVQLFAMANNGCYSDTIEKIVNVYGTNAFAGNDTIVAANQPLQLNGQGGVLYQWSPATSLSDPNISNPVAVLQQDARYVLTAFTPVGCPTTDTVNIKVYKGPAMYVPNAFTPNGDGRNERFRFIPVGMTEVTLFQVYNRYGQLVYSSTDPSRGWDGTVNGKKQPSGTYVWMLKGKDFLGQTHFNKGTVTLIR